ncbi:uncharacterized protein BJ171DRAFT_43117 [Polychytrium aggregatum]|uniref:uncharacterized protein n=1 Tax=Polychytrium aggregatum TaxID=110093 RepID=UPI0022FE9AD2|nr:uncharacterized protein BJ171DRAFT_43117 [Polychytrium aggregatum]KAI9206209.1 hypothetical protein BJ171DRAFT_43117 [Polychytrium aggregatum]
MDDWLANANENEFDEQMEKYLGTDGLLHYPQEIRTRSGKIISTGEWAKRKGRSQRSTAKTTSSAGASRAGTPNWISQKVTPSSARHDQLPPLGPFEPLVSARDSQTDRHEARESNALPRRRRRTRASESRMSQPTESTEDEYSDESELSEGGLEDDWQLESSLSQILHDKNQKRYSEMEAKATRREALKDPMERLKVFQRQNRKMHRQQDTHPLSSDIGRRVVYEWDTESRMSPVEKPLTTAPSALVCPVAKAEPLPVWLCSEAP